MNDHESDEQRNWHQKPVVRVVLLLLLPLIVGGLYLISTYITLTKPPSVPATPEPSVPER
ncbi:MAG: hypothetical protein KME06_04580 [Kastovskya adunca ATA6-11-RM4]|jgi:hypothetical protein|nr:hypothetical protein [Kastovskya adunca ATA6-11-RM4]